MNVVLKNISKSYGGCTALADCSVSFPAGTFNAIIGPNGSGKSTLLRIAALLERPDSGEVVYTDGEDVLRVDLSLRRRIAVVLPGDSLFNDSVFNNVAYALRIRGVERRVVSERVHDILGRLRLSDKAHAGARSLSSGEAQRVAVARALVAEPRCLFLDEPTVSLDPVNTEIIETVLREIGRGRGMTIVMITHNMFQAQRLAERVIFMYGGRIIEEAECERIFTAPEKELTSRFLTGRMVW